MYRTKATLLITILAASAVSWSAQAAVTATYSLDPLGMGLSNFLAGEANTNGSLGTAFSDAFTFVAPVNSSITVTVADYPWPGYTSSGLSLALDSYNPATQAVGVELVSAAVGKPLTFSNLSANGAYALVVNGTASGSSGGLFAFTTNVSAVPIPGAVVLFGSGLVGLAALGRRRGVKEASAES